MYGVLLPLFLCMSVATSAPQDNSAITYVKPLVEDSSPSQPDARESRIEKLPLIIGAGNVLEATDSKYLNDQNQTSNDQNEPSNDQNQPSNDQNEPSNDQNKPSNDQNQPSNDQNPLGDRRPENTRNNNIANDYTTLSYESSETTEVTERSSSSEVTERSSSSDEVVEQTEAYETRVRAPTPRFLPKLSYIKTDKFEGPAVSNYIESGVKRRFRSRCRCEKIWNCPRLQITVPRCPDEYFMCCF